MLGNKLSISVVVVYISFYIVYNLFTFLYYCYVTFICSVHAQELMSSL